MVHSEILDLEMPHATAGPDDQPLTVRRYLFRLLEELIQEDERFSGKRPFGNSGWIFDFAHTFVQHGLVKGQIDEYTEDGETYFDLAKCDIQATTVLLVDLTKNLFYPQGNDK